VCALIRVKLDEKCRQKIWDPPPKKKKIEKLELARTLIKNPGGVSVFFFDDVGGKKRKKLELSEMARTLIENPCFFGFVFFRQRC
jgi:hypothetical protein